MKRQFIFLFLLATLFAGCGIDNSIHVLQITLPANDTGSDLYAFVQIRSSRNFDFNIDWGGMEDIDGFFLTSEAVTQEISVVAEPEDYESDLLVRVSFCEDSACGAQNLPRRQLEIIHPFYSGKETRSEWTIDEIPEDQSEPVVVIE